MKEMKVVRYERKSTLWPHANMFYVMTDWTLMECFFADFSDDRKEYENRRWFDIKGNDVTDKVIEEKFSDCYMIRLTNDRRTNSQSFRFKTKDEANNFFLNKIKRHSVFGNFRRVS